jgi:very-short-patch-repair endonuclease
VGVDVRFSRTLTMTASARRLRRNPTEAEARLWRQLRADRMGAKFRWQHPAGRYVLDFFSPEIGLAIEVDGGQHGNGATVRSDAARRRWLAERGVKVLRFWNPDVMENLEGVLAAIASEIAALRRGMRTPTRRWRADLPLAGGGEAGRRLKAVGAR